MQIISGKRWCLIVLLLLAGIFRQTEADEKISICCKEVIRDHSDDSLVCTFEDVEAPYLSELVFTNCNYYQQQSEVYFRNSYIYEFPRNWFKFEPYTRVMSIDNCSLTSMSRFAFEYAQSNLIELNIINNNNLTVLEAALFSYASSLQTINLSSNKIIDVDENTFKGLNNLRELNLGSNQIKKLKSGLLQPLTSLERLDLSDNLVEVIEKELFEHNSALLSVKLQQNKIIIVQDSVFANLLELEELQLHSNELKEFNMTRVSAQNVFLYNNQIESLYIPDTVVQVSADNNSISQISCAENTKLQTLYLSHNNLTKLGCVADLTNLEKLSLSFNQLGSLDISAFASLEKLKILNLDFTQISSPEFGTFSHLGEITRLDISYNKFQELDLSVMAGLSNLNYLYIDGNNLTEFDYKSVRTLFPKLTVIGIADNNFNCSYLSQIAKVFNSNGIAYSPANLVKVRDSPNVKGIACTNEKNKKNVWKTPILHLAMGNHSEVIQVMNNQINDLIDNVNILNKSAGAMDTMKSDYHDLTLLFHKLQERMHNLEADQLKTKLGILTNNTNASATSLSNDLKNVIEQMNNLTIDRQKLNNDVMQQKLYEMSFQVEKLSNKFDELSNKMKAMQKSGQPTTGALRDSINHDQAAGTGTVNIIILVLLIINVLIMTIAGVAYYMRRRYMIPQHNMSRTTTRTFDTQILDHPL